MPEFLQIGILRILGGFDAERRVAAGAAGTGLVILHLDRFRQSEEIPRGVIRALDQLIGHAVTTDAAETPFAVSGAQIGDESLAVGLETADV